MSRPLPDLPDDLRPDPDPRGPGPALGYALLVALAIWGFALWLALGHR